MRFLRLSKIFFMAWRYGLYELALTASNKPGLRWLARLMCMGCPRDQSRGARLRLFLERLGPIFVKFGQLLSTRQDLFPDDIVEELTKLQDQVPPFNSEIAIRLIEQSLRRPLKEIFNDFEVVPAASASIAQVHFATLRYGPHAGKAVAIKVLRPGVLRIINKDLALLRVLAVWIERWFSDGRRLKPREVVAEFDQYLHDELDLMREAANASQLRRNFSDSELLQIPEIYWDYTSSMVLVMERMYGIPIGQIDRLKAAGVDLKKLAREGVEIFFTQFLRDGFFHADMHPGNILVSVDASTLGRYIALDFGIVGTLSDFDRHYLAQNFLAFFQHDYRRVAVLHIESGWVPAHTRVEALEAAIRTCCEPYFDRPLKDISLGLVLLRLFQTSRRFDVEIQPQLVLLQKTLLNIEGLGRQLDPDLDLWKTAKPFLECWIKQQTGWQGSQWSKMLPQLPRLIYQTMHHRASSLHETASHQLLKQLCIEQKRNKYLMLCLCLLLGIVGGCLVFVALKFL